MKRQPLPQPRRAARAARLATLAVLTATAALAAAPRLAWATEFVDPSYPGQYDSATVPVELGNTGVSRLPGPYTPIATGLQLEKNVVFNTEVFALDQEEVAKTTASDLENKVPCLNWTCLAEPPVTVNGNPDSPPPSYVPWQPLAPQNYYNTCGPSSTRLWAWHKSGTDPGESPFYNKEGVTPNTDQGTSDGQIANAINSWLGYTDVGPSADSPDISNPPTPPQLHAMVVEDSYYYGESVIQNVDTGQLQNWKGTDGKIHEFEHFDVIYGYDDDNGGNLYVAEEYDPHYLGYNTNWEPYGMQKYTASVDDSAVSNSPDHDVVW